jgi:hypothetical protein
MILDNEVDVLMMIQLRKRWYASERPAKNSVNQNRD